MGTRNLSMLVKDEKMVVAQYGQWDGYPDGQGIVILNFLKNVDIKEFIKKLKKVRFLNENDFKEKSKFLESIGVKNRWLNREQYRLLNEKYPYFNRDHGGKIFELIMKSSDDEILLEDNSNLAYDSLFCEHGYLIDLDSNKFEIYRGFNQDRLDHQERFYDDEKNRDGYYAIKLMKKYDIDNLPDNQDFCKEIEAQDE